MMHTTVFGLGDGLHHIVRRSDTTWCGLPSGLADPSDRPVTCGGCMTAARRARLLAARHEGEGSDAASVMRLAAQALLGAADELDPLPADPDDTDGDMAVYAESVAAVPAGAARRRATYSDPKPDSGEHLCPT